MRRQLTHEYVQKSTRTTRPRRLSYRDRIAVDPVGDPSELRRDCRRARRGLRGLVSREPQPSQLALCPRALLDLLLEGLRVAGNRSRELLVGAERDRDRRDADEGTRDAPGRLRVPAEEAHALGEPLAADGDREHRHSGATGVGDRHEERLEPAAAGRRQRGHRGEHRPGAGDEDETQARAQHDPAALGARPPAGEEEQGPLREPCDGREEQRRRQHEEHHDRKVAKRVLRQPQRIEQRAPDDREDAEAADEAEDDPERPAAGRAAAEQDREHGQDARRDSRDQPSKEGDPEEDHPLRVGREPLRPA